MTDVLDEMTAEAIAKEIFSDGGRDPASLILAYGKAKRTQAFREAAEWCAAKAKDYEERGANYSGIYGDLDWNAVYEAVEREFSEATEHFRCMAGQPHYHVAGEVEPDKCQDCGRNVRDPVHRRMAGEG